MYVVFTDRDSAILLDTGTVERLGSLLASREDLNVDNLTQSDAHLCLRRRIDPKGSGVAGVLASSCKSRIIIFMANNLNFPYLFKFHTSPRTVLLHSLKCI